ncbi:MAG: hypothetical protein SFU83_23675 [Meiothermus sp.]|nr:hypothetical protein [Meiothermus sp.]
MAAATEPRDTVRREGRLLSHPVKANVTCFQGTIAVRDAAGFAAPGSTAVGLVALGMFPQTYDNAGGANGAIAADIEPGIYKWENSAAGDLITSADVGNDCFIVDDQTVAKTSGANTRSVAGKVVAVDADGVWVATGFLA